MIPPPTRHLTALIAPPLLVAVGLYALTALTGNVWFTLLAGASIGLLVAALATRPRLDQLRLCLTGPDRTAVGDLVAASLHVHNDSPRRSPPLELGLQVRGLADLRIHVLPLPPGGRAAVQLSQVAISRGVTEHCLITLKTMSGLGMMCTHASGSYGHRLVIHPRRVDAPAVEQHTFLDESADPVRGPGLEIAGVREWRPGDPASRVHWRSSARRGSLVVRERGVSSTRHVVVAVACSSAAADWEDVVALAASACRAAQVAGHRLTLLVWADGALASPPVHAVPDLLDWWAALGRVDQPDAATLSRTLAAVGAADAHLVLSAAAPR